MTIRLIAAALGVAFALSPARAQDAAKPAEAAKPDDTTKAKAGPKPVKLEKATFGGGCFWCIEAVYERLPGVKSVVSGYSGGSVPNPTYEMVGTGETGHAEVVQLEFDPEQVSYESLVHTFLKSHDPTTLNSQGPDHGTQYRSIILYHSEAQRKDALKVAAELRAKKAFRAPIVTELVPFVAFYPAELYHQDYYRLHPNTDYSRAYITPKVRKLIQSGATKASKTP